MPELAPVMFESGGKKLSLTITPKAGAEHAIEAAITAPGGGGVALVTYRMTDELRAAWDLDAAGAQRFMARFARFHMRTRLAEGGASPRDEYVFDMDFAASRPETVIERMEKEWAARV